MGTSLTTALTGYCQSVERLQLPPNDPPVEADFAESWQYESAVHVYALCQRIRGMGERVTDRLQPGLTDDELRVFEDSIGFDLAPSVREWFQWHNGHAGGLYDDGDPIATLLPFGRQIDVAEATELMVPMSEAVALIRQYEQLGPELPFLVLQAHDRYFYVECGLHDQGAVWFFDPRGNPAMRRAYDSLRDVVDNAQRLIDDGWARLNISGGVEIPTPEELEQRGVPFADDLERNDWWSFGMPPASA